MNNKVIIYTDGACRGNGNTQNKGGYGIVLNFNNKSKYIYQAFDNTTNNMMELGAVITALKKLTRSCVVEVYSDSKYVCDAINKKWLTSWKMKGWKRGKGEILANKEMWIELDELLKKHTVTFTWVKGHASNELNNLCDLMANYAIDNECYNEVFTDTSILE